MSAVNTSRLTSMDMKTPHQFADILHYTGVILLTRLKQTGALQGLYLLTV